jgi:hypothetical protein
LNKRQYIILLSEVHLLNNSGHGLLDELYHALCTSRSTSVELAYDHAQQLIARQTWVSFR